MPPFVEVIVEATGRRETVPSDWLDSPVLGKGISLAPPSDEPAPVIPTPEPVSEVQTVHGEASDLPFVPAARDAILAAREAEASGPADEVPTEDDTHAVIDEFAAKQGIDLGDAKTKAEKVAVINHETPAAGEEEN